MNNIIRFYWICWDNSNGTDGEEVFRTETAARRFFDGLPATVPYKKMVACYNDHDVTLSTVRT